MQTDVNITGPVAVSVDAIVSSSYNPASGFWVVSVKTLTNRPYKLSALVASTSGAIQTNNRLSSYAISDNTACNSNGLSCTQTITLSFNGCGALSGGVVIQATPVRYIHFIFI